MAKKGKKSKKKQVVAEAAPVEVTSVEESSAPAEERTLSDVIELPDEDVIRSSEDDVRPAVSSRSIIITVIAGLAAALLVALSLLFFVFKFRVIRYKSESGVRITFVGRVDGDGQPISGRFRFSDGLSGSVNTSTGEIEYSDGTKYKGTLVDLEKSGYGTLTYSNGDRYEGYFEKDVFSGSGKYTFADGDSYEGEYKGGKMNGKGTYTWSDGSTYTGDYVDNVKDGTGKFSYSCGDVYEGGFRADLKSGKGTYTWANGDSYTGDFADDMRSGEGTMTWSDGESYVGQFKDNQIEGHGKYTDASGRTYEGTFEAGVPVRSAEPSETDTAS